MHGLPLFHVHGLVLGVLGPLRVGSRLRHVGRPHPERYAARGRLAVLRRTHDLVADRARNPRRRGRCAAPGCWCPAARRCPSRSSTALAALTGHRPLERYGMTETLITVSARADGPRRPGTVGVPLPGVHTRVRDEHGGPLPADGAAMGELQVRGGTLFDGYLNRPDADAATRTADGWFRTGDVATVDPDGAHRIVGRAATDLIKSAAGTGSAPARSRTRCWPTRRCGRRRWSARPTPTWGSRSSRTWSATA